MTRGGDGARAHRAFGNGIAVIGRSDSDQRGVAEVIVAKHRNGPVGGARLVFHADYTTFENAARE